MSVAKKPTANVAPGLSASVAASLSFFGFRLRMSFAVPVLTAWTASANFSFNSGFASGPMKGDNKASFAWSNVSYSSSVISMSPSMTAWKTFTRP